MGSQAHAGQTTDLLGQVFGALLGGVQQEQQQNQQAHTGSCHNCNRNFTFTAQQFDTLPNITCPFCGTSQNLRRAQARHNYDAQQRQQDQQNNQQRVAQNFAVWNAQQNITSIQRQREANQQAILNNQSSTLQYFAPRRRTPTTSTTRGTITSNGYGGYNYNDRTTTQ
jgi:hypothetical protein